MVVLITTTVAAHFAKHGRPTTAFAPRTGNPTLKLARFSQPTYLWLVPTSSRISWVFIVVITLILTCLFTLVSTGRPDAPPFRILHNRQTVAWFMWLIFAPAIIAAARRFPFGEGSQFQWLMRHLAIGTLFSLTGLLIAHAIDSWMRASSASMAPSMTPRPPVVTSIATGILLYLLIAVSYQAVAYHNTARARAMVASKLRADLAEARLATLEGQLHPHFLFNALNSVAALMRIDPSQAEVMIEQLSELLRATLRTNPMHQVPLRDAVHIAEQYLAIEHVRFQERLTTQVRVADDAQHALLPQLLLQPLVENAVRHGIAPLENGGEVRISATVTSHTLHIAIEDTGVGISAAPSAHTGNGLGMRSVRAMLSQLYGERGTLLVAPIVPHGTRVMISLPYTITRS